jgi:hypothetical protein
MLDRGQQLNLAIRRRSSSLRIPEFFIISQPVENVQPRGV